MTKLNFGDKRNYRKQPSEQFGPVYPDLGAGVAKYRRLAAKAGSVRDMAKAERHAYADVIEKAIRAKHRTLHMKPTPSLTAGWYSPPSIARLLKYETPIHMAGDPDWSVGRYNDRNVSTSERWAIRERAVYDAMIAEKRAAQSSTNAIAA